MPFKSKAQARWMFSAQARGELPKGTANRWAAHTKDIKKLPQHVETMDSEKCAELLRQVLDSTDSGPVSTVPSPTLASAGPLFDRAFQNLLRPVLESKTAAFAANSTPVPPALVQPVQGQNLSAYLPYITSLPSATNKPVNVPRITLPTQPQSQPQPTQPSAATPAPAPQAPAPGNKAPNLPGTPGHAATNVIDRMGPLDPSGQTVDGNNAANARGMGAGMKMAKLKAKSALAMTAPPIADEDDTAYPGKTPNIPLMRGWQWKALQQSADEGFSNWMPRIFQTQETPLTELLASPAKQSILQGALGALLGGGAGALAGAVPGSEAVGGSPVLSVGGGLVGGLLGALRGYKSRREENDRIIDALRRTPPGAVLRDWDALRQQDEAAANQAQKQAEQRVMTKIAADTPAIRAVMPRRHVTPGMMERVLTQHPGQGPERRTEELLARAMAAGSPGSLDTVEVQLGASDPVRNYHRLLANKRLGPLGYAYGAVTGLPTLLSGTSEEDDGASGPYYDSLADTVVQPWRAPGTSMHELGHAIDFNNGPVSKNPVVRFLRGLGRDAYTFLPGLTLWKEHAAWRKGRDAFVGGAAKTKLDPKAVLSVLEDAAHSRAPALGTYWGGTLGGAGGLALALYLLRQGAPGRLAGGAGALTGLAGTLAGLGIGTLMRNSAKQRERAFVRDEYRKMIEDKDGKRKAAAARAKLAVVPNPNLVAALQEEQAKQQQALAAQQPQQPQQAMPPGSSMPPPGGDPAAQGQSPPPQPQGQPAQDLIRMSQEARGAPRVPIPPGQPVA